MFSEIKDYGAVFETLVTKTADYLIQNNIKAQILGISGASILLLLLLFVMKYLNVPIFL